MGNNIKDIQQIKSLIAKGKEMGFLTFEEVNKAVPLEMNTPEQFEEIIGIFDQLEIAIVDLEKDGKKIPVTSAETDGEQSEERLELVDSEDRRLFLPQHGPGPYVPARNGRGAAARS
jgi:RNA polymerase primary sigma factor